MFFGKKKEETKRQNQPVDVDDFVVPPKEDWSATAGVVDSKDKTDIMDIKDNMAVKDDVLIAGKEVTKPQEDDEEEEVEEENKEIAKEESVQGEELLEEMSEDEVPSLPEGDEANEEATPPPPPDEEEKRWEEMNKEQEEEISPPPKPSSHVAPQEIPGKEVGTPKGSRGKAVSVWFGTNRKLDQTGLAFTNVRDKPEKKNTYGRVDVEIAIAQRLEPEKTPTLHLKKKKHDDPPIKKQTEEDFFQDIQERVDLVRELGQGVEPQVLVMLHNYNVGFFDCAISTAQLAEDLNIQGPVLSYSWPSVGKSGNYETDSATLERSEPEIMEFLLRVVEKSGVDNVHVIADGKGCHGLLRVLQRISADRVEIKLGQVFLMAPDIDRELFENLAWLFPKYAERTTMYVSDHDTDVLRSVKRHKAPRAGAFEPYTVVDGVDTIAVSQFETDDLQSPRVRPQEVVFVLHDMYDLMKNNDPPCRRMSLIKATSTDGLTFWKYRK